jgi:hypothetical protein
MPEDKERTEDKELTFDSKEFAADTMTILESRAQNSSKPIYHLLEEILEEVGVYPRPNIAVEMCCDSHKTITKQLIAEGRKIELISAAAKVAYGNAMPRLTGADNIRDFIACVAHGMIIGVIPSSEGSRLLYAAQVAYSAIPLSKRRKKRRKTPQMQPVISDPKPTEPIT